MQRQLVMKTRRNSSGAVDLGVDLAGAEVVVADGEVAGVEVGAEDLAGAGKRAKTKAVDQIMHSQHITMSLVTRAALKIESFHSQMGSLF